MGRGVKGKGRRGERTVRWTIFAFAMMKPDFWIACTIFPRCWNAPGFTIANVLRTQDRQGQGVRARTGEKKGEARSAHEVPHPGDVRGKRAAAHATGLRMSCRTS